MEIGNIKKDNFKIVIKHNEEDDFAHLLIVNGIYARDGGSPVDYVTDKIVPEIRKKLVKKYPSIKNGDIKNKLKIYINIRLMKNLEFSSQEKVKITNPKKQLDEVFAGVKWDSIVKKILKDDDIMLSITEYFELKEKAKANAELKKISKVKKLKSDSYTPPTRRKKYLLINEGDSAEGGLMPSLGREECGYFTLRGVPLNSWGVDTKKLLSNKELSELYKILSNEIEVTDMPDGKWYEIQIGTKKIIANENDEIEINGKWVSVTDLLEQQ